MGHRTLVIHPLDETTRFLELAYRGIEATVVTRQVERRQLRRQIERHDQVMLLGHGSAHGLFSVGMCPDSQFVIDADLVDQLSERDNTIGIWCYASTFARDYRLKGVFTGMFVSEMLEAELFGLQATDTEIQESAYLFSNVVGRFANCRPHILKAAIDREYGRLARLNPVARYNHSRIRLFTRGTWLAGRSDVEMDDSHSPPVLPSCVPGLRSPVVARRGVGEGQNRGQVRVSAETRT
jgi:hypothetical protein